MDILVSAERVAEVMWQRGNQEPPVKAHLAWLALPEDEKRFWFDRAEAAIAGWRRLMGQQKVGLNSRSPAARALPLEPTHPSAAAAVVAGEASRQPHQAPTRRICKQAVVLGL